MERSKMKIKLTQALIDVTENKVLVKVGQVLIIDYLVKEQKRRYRYYPYLKKSETVKTSNKIIYYVVTYRKQKYDVPANAAEIVD